MLMAKIVMATLEVRIWGLTPRRGGLQKNYVSWLGPGKGQPIGEIRYKKSQGCFCIPGEGLDHGKLT